MIPALREAATDPRLKDKDVRVLQVLADELDIMAFSPLKEAALRHRLRLHRATLYRSLSRLRAAGYIERGPHVGPGCVATYRLVYQVANVQRTEVA